MALLRRKGGGQSAEEREELRRRLGDLEEQREERLAALGGLAADLHRGGAIDAAALSEPAVAIVALEDQIDLVRRGLDEGLSEEQLKEIADD